MLKQAGEVWVVLIHEYLSALASFRFPALYRMTNDKLDNSRIIDFDSHVLARIFLTKESKVCCWDSLQQPDVTEPSASHGQALAAEEGRKAGLKPSSFIYSQYSLNS